MGNSPAMVTFLRVSRAFGPVGPLVLALILSSPTPAKAWEARESNEPHLSIEARSNTPTDVSGKPILRPEQPIFVGDVHVGVVVPALRDPLCPPESACVFGGGVGLGGAIERRWPSGIGFVLGYDAWLLNGSAVYEVGLMQFLSASVRFVFLREAIFHPYLDVGGGVLVFGDTLKIQTVGVGLQGAAGVEFELTDSISLTLATLFRPFITRSFVTPRDHVARAESAGLNGAFSFQLGLRILGDD